MSDMTSIVEHHQHQLNHHHHHPQFHQHQQQHQQHQQFLHQQQFGGQGHHCKECGVTFESKSSLDVHIRYHHENLMNQWTNQGAAATQQQPQEESNNNNTSCKTADSTGITKNNAAQESVQAPADSSESSSSRPASGSPKHQQQGFNHYGNPMFHDQAGYYMQQQQQQPGQEFVLPQFHSPDHGAESDQGSAARRPASSGPSFHPRYHPYQQHPGYQDRVGSVSSSSPRSPVHCDKCGAVCEDIVQLQEHARTAHASSPMIQQQSQQQQTPAQYQQASRQQQQMQQQQQHASPPNFEFGPRVKQEVKQEPDEQAEILDLDSHKVQTHRFDDELQIRIHQQRQQELANHQMQLHHQAMQQQHANAHSVSSMLNWPPNQAPPVVPPPPQQPQPDYHGGNPMVESVQSPQDQFLGGSGPRGPAGSPIITSTQPAVLAGPQHPATGLIAQHQNAKTMSGNQSWKSNEARRPKTYNCTACNKWFTSSGHLKRHYNTTLHKNAVKQSNQPDPATLPISAHHHPGRDNVGNRNSGGGVGRTGGGGSASRSPELTSSSSSPPNLMAGPSGEATRGLLHTPTNNTSSNSSNSSVSSESSPQTAQAPVQVLLASTLCQQQVQEQSMMLQQSRIPYQAGLSSTLPESPTTSNISTSCTPPHLHQQQQRQMDHLQMAQQQQQHQLLNSSTTMGSGLQSQQQQQHHHTIISPTPIMGSGLPQSMASPPPGSTMIHQQQAVSTIQPYPNDLPPHVTIITTSQHQPLAQDSTIIRPIITGNQEYQQQVQLPSFNSFHQIHQSWYYQAATDVGGLSSPGEDTNTSNSSSNNEYDCYMQDIQQHMENNNNSTKELVVKEAFEPEVMTTTLKKRGRKPLARKPVAQPMEAKGDPAEGLHYISRDGLHKCIKCNKVFNKACYLTQHNKSFHSGEKPFKCNQCGKRFPQEYLHAEHLQKHAGDKPYKCEICPKQFNHKTDLRRHLCLHTGEKPYACDNCGKGFIRKDHMMKHLETHKRKSRMQLREKGQL